METIEIIINETVTPIILEVYDGVPGDSAYVVAVKNGFTGTETEWLESLQGGGGGGAPTGSAGGDLGSAYPNPTVVGIKGKPIESTPAGNNEVLIYNSSATQWEHAPLATDSVVNNSSVTGTTTTEALNALNASLGNKVDKVSGKGLSSEDYSTAEKNKLASITEIFTTALKTAYDSAVAWIATNGSNLINHLSNTSNPHSTTASQVGAVAVNSAITGATKTKITYDSKGLVTSGADATTADIADSTDKRYQTDAQQTNNDATSPIQAQLDNRTKTLIKSTTPTSGVNSTLVETIIFNSGNLIPANTFSANDILNIVSLRFKSGGLGGNIIYKYYVNTTNNLSGSPILLGGYYQSSAGSTFSKIANKTCSINGGNIESFVTIGTGSNIDSGQYSTGLSSSAFNIAVDQYFIVTATLGASNTNNARLVEILITN